MNSASKVIVLATLLGSVSCYAMESVAASGKGTDKSTGKSTSEGYKKDSCFQAAGRSRQGHAGGFGNCAVPIDG